MTQQKKTFDEVVGSEAMIREVHFRGTEPAQMVFWARQAADFATAIVESDTPTIILSEALRSMFWIRLYGVVAELDPQFFAKRVPTRYVEDVRTAIGAVRTKLEREELILLEYRRTVEAHPMQDAFSPLRESASALFPKEKRGEIVREGAQLLIKYSAEFGPASDRVLSHEIAKKTLQPLKRLHETLETWRIYDGNHVQISVGHLPRK